MSTAIKASPALVSVVIPVRGREPGLVHQLRALANQTYAGEWEVVVVNNGMGEQALRASREWADRIPGLRVVDCSSRRGINRARNAGVAAASGDFLAFCDADNVAAPGWLEGLVDAARSADIVGGETELDALNSRLTRTWFDWDPPAGLLTGTDRFLPHPPGGNCGVWAKVARDVGWDEDFTYGSSDKEFAWRAQLASYRVGFAPGAVMHKRFRSTPGAIARQYFRYGLSSPRLYRRFRGEGMPRSAFAEAALHWRWVVRQAPAAWRSVELRGKWVRIAALRLGRLVGSLRSGVAYL